LGARHSLRPLFSRGQDFSIKLGRIVPRECEAMFEIIWLFENRIPVVITREGG
jgi:hypothetical protein